MGGIIGMGVLATLVNMAGALQRGKGTVDSIMGGFIVTTILILIGQTKAKPIATLFMLAFLITSLSVNGFGLFNTISHTVSGENEGMKLNG